MSEVKTKARDVEIGKFYDFVDYSLTYRPGVQFTRMMSDHYGRIVQVNTLDQQTSLEVEFDEEIVDLEVDPAFILEEIEID